MSSENVVMYAFDICIGITVKTPYVYTKLILRVSVCYPTSLTANISYVESTILLLQILYVARSSHFHRVAVQLFIKRNPDNMPALITLLVN